MGLARRAQNGALWSGFATVVLLLVLAALGFLAASLLIWLTHLLGAAAATGLTGLVLMVLAGLVGLYGQRVLRRRKQAEPSPTIELAAALISLTAALLTRRGKRANPPGRTDPS